MDANWSMCDQIFVQPLDASAPVAHDTSNWLQSFCFLASPSRILPIVATYSQDNNETMVDLKAGKS